MSSLKKVLDTHAKVIEEGFKLSKEFRYRSYAVSALRGGVGKSTLTFNLAYEISKKKSLLLADLCPQCNLTDSLLRGNANSKVITVLQSLQPRVLGPSFGSIPHDPSFKVSIDCNSFKPNKVTFLISGSPEMFAFPSSLYQQLQLANAQSSAPAVCSLLETLRDVVTKETEAKGTELTLMDTSPFYAGGTHLAWCAADALIIPVRVDEHSIDSLELTLNMLDNPTKDFATWNKRAGGRSGPKVAAVVMTMVGARSRTKTLPDKASLMYIDRAIRIAEKHASLFEGADPAESFVITDDFVSAGRISGAQVIPISDLKVGEFYTVEGKRLQVNSSKAKYSNELEYLASML